MNADNIFDKVLCDLKKQCVDRADTSRMAMITYKISHI